MDADQLANDLRDVLGDPARVSTGDSDRDLHSEDMTFHAAHRRMSSSTRRRPRRSRGVLALADEQRMP